MTPNDGLHDRLSRIVKRYTELSTAASYIYSPISEAARMWPLIYIYKNQNGECEIMQLSIRTPIPRQLVSLRSAQEQKKKKKKKEEASEDEEKMILPFRKRLFFLFFTAT